MGARAYWDDRFLEMWRVTDVARVGYGTGSGYLWREENGMELVGRCEVLYFGVVLSDNFIIGFPDTNTMHGCLSICLKL